MNPCKKIILEVSNYLDNEMDAALRQELEEHMGCCPECRIIIDTTRQTIQVYRGCEPYPLPQSLHNRLQQAIREHFGKLGGESS